MHANLGSMPKYRPSQLTWLKQTYTVFEVNLGSMPKYRPSQLTWLITSCSKELIDSLTK